MKWELHQLALLDCVDTAAGVESRLPLTTVSVKCILLEESSLYVFDKQFKLVLFLVYFP